MSKPNDGGSAFPRPTVYYQRHDGAFVTEEGEPGMSLRQYYAGLAMQWQLANSHAMKNLYDTHGERFILEFPVKCVMLADALIAELEKETT